MKTAAIIQARMSSTRLPGKILADIAGRPLIARVIERVKAVAEIDEVVVATTVSSADDPLVDWLQTEKPCLVFRGSEHDVLDRYYRCAMEQNASIIARITADDPLKDPRIIQHALDILLADPLLDYCSNTIKPTFPEGLDIEVFRISALEHAHKQATLPSEREHVTPYITKNPAIFHLASFEMERDLSTWRWTVDKPEDLEFMRRVFERFKDVPLVSYLEVIDFLDDNPEIRNLNANTLRNEGYLNSLARDKAWR